MKEPISQFHSGLCFHSILRLHFDHGETPGSKAEEVRDTPTCLTLRLTLSLLGVEYLD